MIDDEEREQIYEAAVMHARAGVAGDLRCLIDFSRCGARFVSLPACRRLRYWTGTGTNCSEQPLQQLVHQGRWRKRRAHQLRLQPLCERCGAEGRVEPATCVDHVRSHRGDYNAFWLGPVQSLCTRCHDLKTRGERDALAGRWEKGVRPDGMPTDLSHPAWRERP